MISILLSRLCFTILAALAAASAHAATNDATQWRPWETVFEAESSSLDPATFELNVSFAGPGNERFDVSAFWDGDRRWMVRFAPTAAGEWSFATACPGDGRDPGLHCRTGTLNARAAEDGNPLFRHGGFLRVSPNRHYLTYSDGTPFFWLGDTWWFCPSKLCPLHGSSNSGIPSMFKALVDTRKQQGFTVAQMMFLGPGGAAEFIKSSRTWTPERIAVWREVDQYFAYANDAGIMPALGIGFHSSVDAAALDDFKLLWRYVVARYGAFAVTWLIVGEYNLNNVPERVQKVLELGRFIKQIDPYHRAMSVHPAKYGEDRRQVWQEPWLDFIMLQGGHKNVPPVRAYSEAYEQRDAKPVLESESNYEGIGGISADRVRLAAYRAIQSGSFGYTYGANGLWYPKQNLDDRRFPEYGASLPWWESLARPGAAQMGLLREIYERVEWWKLEPRPNAVFTVDRLPDEQRILTKADGDSQFVIYFPAGLTIGIKLALLSTDPKADYSGIWVSPRDGSTRPGVEGVRADGTMLQLPAVPDQSDWILLLRKTGMAGLASDRIINQPPRDQARAHQDE